MTTSQSDIETTGLMAFWASFEDQHMSRYLEWHNCEHMEERVSNPGFQSGRRYKVYGTDGRFLMMYETNTSSVLGSDAYMDALNSPTPWTKEVLGYFREPVRNIYELIGSCGDPSAFPAPYLAALRFNLVADREDELLPSYSNQWLSKLCELEHVSRARLFRVDAEISNIVTSERKIYGGGPGAQRYLALIDVHKPFEDVGDPISIATQSLFSAEHGRVDEFSDQTWIDFAINKKHRG